MPSRFRRSSVLRFSWLSARKTLSVISSSSRVSRKSAVGQRDHHGVDKVAAGELQRRAGVAGRGFDQIAVRSDQRELNHVAAGHLHFPGPEFQAEGGRLLRVKRARDPQRLIDPFEYPLGIFLKQFGDTVSVRPRLLQRFRAFRSRDRKIAGPRQRQKEQRDLQRSIAQDCPCGLADPSADVDHGVRSLAGRSRRATLSERGNAIKYDTNYLRLNRPNSAWRGPATPRSCNPTKVGPAALSFGFRQAQGLMSETPVRSRRWLRWAQREGMHPCSRGIMRASFAQLPSST